MTDQHTTPTIEPTDAGDADAVVADAVVVIDNALAQMLNRELVSANEVSDLLLDVRSLLTK